MRALKVDGRELAAARNERPDAHKDAFGEVHLACTILVGWRPGGNPVRVEVPEACRSPSFGARHLLFEVVGIVKNGRCGVRGQCRLPSLGWSRRSRS